MSLYGALFTGVSGLSAQSRAIASTSNNIANINTVSYKESETQFATLLASSGGVSSFSSGGVQAKAINRIEQQGLIQATNSISDLAINGNGFFAVSSDATNSTGGDLVYTRAGSFTTDTSGYLRNAGGYYLQGWRLDAAGNIPANR
ncbi:MAG: flagellar hook-basal body complex protein, partial [Pseudomonadota bacterium]